MKHERRVAMALPAVKALLATARAVNMRKARVLKQAVIIMVNLNVMSSLGSGRRNEKGHQTKSLSVTQLWKSVSTFKSFILLSCPSNFQRSFS